MARTVAMAMLLVNGVAGFVSPVPRAAAQVSVRMTTTLEPEVAVKEAPAAPPAAPVAESAPEPISVEADREGGELIFKRYADTTQSPLFPSLARPELLDGSHAGDYGFDPAGFVKTNQDLYTMMEAEVRHCRLAMLCAAGMPMSELRPWFGGALLTEDGRAPTIPNGHFFDSPSFLFVLGVFGLFGALELNTMGTAKKSTLYGWQHSLDYKEIEDEWPWGVAGDANFDPLGLYGIVGKDAVGRKVMRDLEINHGRVAMCAVALYVLLEAATHTPVVDITPFLFANF